MTPSLRVVFAAALAAYAVGVAVWRGVDRAVVDAVRSIGR